MKAGLLHEVVFPKRTVKKRVTDCSIWSKMFYVSHNNTEYLKKRFMTVEGDYITHKWAYLGWLYFSQIGINLVFTKTIGRYLYTLWTQI